jgi:epoxyqueuosine reductase QueG
MNTICADEIKRRASELGMDLCGIASVESFADAPRGFHPTDIVKDCKTVIVMAVRFPVSTLSSPSPATYTFVRNKVMDKVDSITCQLAAELEELGSGAVPIPSSDPYDYWDDSRRHGQGVLSLKHAAVRAGLGQMGKNTLLINDRLGNMLWLGAVLLNKELEPDLIADYQACIAGCRICLQSCPAEALDGTTIVQSKCRGVSAKRTEGGGGVYACNLCRKLCPRHKGIQ